jgi:hypothetical protein
MRKKFTLMAILIICVASVAWAGTKCDVATLADYIADGSCSIGSFTFSDFNYSSSSYGGASMIPASGVTVTPDGLGFTFSAPWLVGSKQGEDSLIGYSVDGGAIDSVGLLFAGYSQRGTGLSIVSETSADPAFSLSVYDDGGIRSSDWIDLTGVDSLTLTKDIALAGGKWGSASVSSVTNQINGTPEPGSLLLIGTGLVVLGSSLRRSYAK